MMGEKCLSMGERSTMTKSILCCVSILGFIAAAGPARAAEQPAKDRHVLRGAASSPNSSEDECETRIRKLEASDAEGRERLDEKNEVIDHCARQYKRDRTIERLVKACATYEQQPVVKQQSVAECQLAAFKYANALRTLKAEYRK
jgi:hypothetical protein